MAGYINIQCQLYGPGNRGYTVYCYPELAVSSPAAIASTHCVHPRKDGQAEFAWVTR